MVTTESICFYPLSMAQKTSKIFWVGAPDKKTKKPLVTLDDESVVKAVMYYIKNS